MKTLTKVMLLWISMLIIASLFLSFTSALFPTLKETPTLKSGVEISDTANEYPAIEITDWLGLGGTKADLVLTEHTQTCSSDCMSQFQITTYSDSPLVDDVKFWKINDDGSQTLSNIRSYQFYIQTDSKEIEVPNYEYQCTNEGVSANGTAIQTCKNIQTGTHPEITPEWMPYTIGTEMPSGTYVVKLVGDKRSEWSYDWKIDTQGKTLNEWSVWGSGSQYNAYASPSTLPNTAGPNGQKGGMKIYAKNNITIQSFAIGPNTGGDSCYVLDSAKNVIYTGTLTNRVCSFTTGNISSGAYYYLAVAQVGGTGTYNFDYDAGGNYAGVSTYFNWTNGLDPNGASDVNRAYIVKNVTLKNNDVSTITLNSPADGYTSPTNLVTFNATANVVGGSTLTNMSLLFDGIINQTFIPYGYNSTQWWENETQGVASTYSTANPEGANITTNVNLSIVKVVQISGNANTRCYVNDNAGNTLCSGTFSGDNCALTNCNLNAGNSYRVFVDGNGASVTHSVFSGATSITGRYINWTGGFDKINSPAVNVRSVQNIVVANAVGISSATTTFNAILYTSKNWSIQACDSDGVCGLSENRTVNIDTQAPSINLLYPTGTIPIASIGQNISLNYSITDTNLGSCWYNYNGTTNVSISCTSNSSFILGTQKSIILYANDSVGNLNTSSFSWDYNVFENSQTFSPSTTSTTTESFILNVSYDSNYYISAISTLIYNGTPYIGTKIGSGNTVLFNRNITIPAITGSIPFYWQISLTDPSNVITYFNSTSYTQSVIGPIFAFCNSTLTTVALNYTIYTEGTQTPLLASLSSAIHYSLTAGSDSLSYSFSNTTQNSSNYKFCINSNQTYYISGLTAYYRTDSEQRDYIFSSALISNITTNIPLYLLPTAQTDVFTFKVIDQSQQPVTNALVYVQRWDIGTDTYQTIGMLTTDSNGNGIINLRLNDAYYREIVYYNGLLYLTTTPTKETCVAGTTCGKELPINLLNINPYQQFSNIAQTISFNNATNNVLYTFADNSGESDIGCLKVYQLQANATTLLSNTCVMGTANTLAYNILNNGTYMSIGCVRLSANFSNSQQCTENLYTNLGTPARFLIIGTFGHAISLLLIGTAAFFGVAAGSIPLGIFGIVAALLASFYLGWLNLSGWISSFIAIIVLLVVSIKRSGR